MKSVLILCWKSLDALKFRSKNAFATVEVLACVTFWTPWHLHERDIGSKELTVLNEHLAKWVLSLILDLKTYSWG